MSHITATPAHLCVSGATACVTAHNVSFSLPNLRLDPSCSFECLKLLTLRLREILNQYRQTKGSEIICSNIFTGRRKWRDYPNIFHPVRAIRACALTTTTIKGNEPKIQSKKECVPRQTRENARKPSHDLFLLLIGRKKTCWLWLVSERCRALYTTVKLKMALHDWFLHMLGLRNAKFSLNINLWLHI